MLKNDSYEFVLCNTYAPNDDCPEFFVQLCELLESYDNPNKIIAGDMNLVMDIEIDKKWGINQTNS